MSLKLTRIFTWAACLGLVTSAMAEIDSELLAGFKARAIGPAAVGGRIAAIDAVHSDPNRMVIGVATGGVWMTDNGGLTWRAVFDDQPVASIGAVAINQSNPDIIWVGTGEGNTRNSTSIGGGVFKSVDGGHSWSRVGLAGSERINRIALHPTDPDIAYVAALGTLWAPNSERGVYRTSDGGERWQRVLYVDENTGATDIKMDPSNPRKLIAGMWEFRRWPYHFKSGGPGSGMYISLDGGETWARKTTEDGLPAGELGRMAFSFAASMPSRIYALVEAEQSALLRSDDGGRSWDSVNQAYNVADRPFYYMEIIADPRDPNRVYNMATRLRVSIDGGKTFEQNPVIECCAPGNTVHIDNHAFWINPADPRHLVIGNDGGIAISRDRGVTWRFVRNLPLAQFYHIRVDNQHPYHVYGGMQDNGSWRGPAEVWLPAGIRNLHWQEVGFGDGFDTIPDPEFANAGYVMSQGGFLMRFDLDAGEQRMIRPAPSPGGPELRFNWDAGFAQDPFDAATIYYGSQFLHRSGDRGASWSVISPDLTSNKPEWQTYHESGGLTADVTAAENYTTIVAVAPSGLERGLIWVGTDDGRVHLTRDGGGAWERVDERARDIPAGAWVPMIAPSPHAADEAFVVLDDHRRGDMAPYLYRVSDFGRRWTRLGEGQLRGYALSVRQDHVDPDLLFAGTEFGLWFSTDGGANWTRFTAGLPTVSVMDMAIQQRETDLVLGTHGRSVYVIDDYSGLRGLDSGRLEQPLAILSATTGQHYARNPTASTRFTGSGEFRGENEAYGVVVTFVANGAEIPHPDPERERERRIAQRADAQPDAAGDADDPPRVQVSIANSAGQLIRQFKQPVHRGVNRLAWDLKVDGVRPPPGPDSPEQDADLPPGPEVAPGDYRLILAIGEAEASIDVSTAADPRSPHTQSDFEARYQAALRVQAVREGWVTSLESIEQARSDLSTIDTLAGRRLKAGGDSGLASLRERVGDMKDRLDELEKTFRNPPQTKGIAHDADKVFGHLEMAEYYVGTTHGAPSGEALRYVQRAEASLDQARQALQAFFADELAPFRDTVAAAGIGLLAAAGEAAD